MNEFIYVYIHRKILSIKTLELGMVKYQVYKYFYYKQIRLDISSKKIPLKNSS